MGLKDITVRRIVVMVAIGTAAYFLFGFVLMGSKVFSGSAVLGLAPMIVGLPAGLWLQARIRQGAVAEHPRCGHCGYNLTGHAAMLQPPSGVCPECGESFADVPVIPRGRPDARQLSSTRLRLSLLSAVCLTVALLGGAGIVLRQGEFRQHLWILALPIILVWFSVFLSWWRDHKTKA